MKNNGTTTKLEAIKPDTALAVKSIAALRRAKGFTVETSGIMHSVENRMRDAAAVALSQESHVVKAAALICSSIAGTVANTVRNAGIDAHVDSCIKLIRFFRFNGKDVKFSSAGNDDNAILVNVIEEVRKYAGFDREQLTALLSCPARKEEFSIFCNRVDILCSAKSKGVFKGFAEAKKLAKELEKDLVSYEF